MSRAPRIDWAALEREILSRLDIVKEAEAIGIRFAGVSASSDWRSCHAVGREDANPSAAICIGGEAGPLGRYKDFGGGEEKTISFFELAARLSPFKNFREARRHYAERVGIAIPAASTAITQGPKTISESIARQLKLNACDNDQLVEYYAMTFAESRPGLTKESVLAASPVSASWPASNRNPYRVIAFFGYRPADWSSPTSVVMYQFNGQPFPAFGRESSPKKCRLLKCSTDGLIVLGGPDALVAAETAWLCEGLPDACALHPLLPAGHVAVTSTAGAQSFHHGMGPAFSGKNVLIVMDRDVAGVAGARKREAILTPGQVGCAEVRIVELPYPVAEKHGRDLRDWINEGHNFDDLQKLADAALPSRIGRLEIEVTTDEFRVNNEALDALTGDPAVFKRGGCLVFVADDSRHADGIARAESQPTIRRLPRDVLREKLAQHAEFVSPPNEEGDRKSCHVPDFTTKAIHARGVWPGIRQLAGIATSPIMRADGSILTEPGYDPPTELYLASGNAGIVVPEEPSRDDAVRALESLYDVVCDFPFEKPEHKSAWAALVLTPLARQAFQGPAPLFLVDANVRGSGKSLLIDLASIVVQGRSAARMTNPRDEEEARKQITSIVMAGDPLILIDNIVGGLGGAALDAALTGTVWRDRKLGANELIELPLQATWTATGNNVVLKADTSRRVLHIRLQSPLETPESRTGFKHSNVRAHAVTIRRDLLTAALTILRAYYVAGCPKQPIPAWGSFEGWSFIRQALIWAGQPDPAATRQELVEAGDLEFLALRTIIETWTTADPRGSGLTAAQIVEVLKGHTVEQAGFREAMLELCPPTGGTSLPCTRQVAKRLGGARGRIVGGRTIDYREARARTRLWRVVEASNPCANEVVPESPKSPSGDFGANGDSPTSAYRKAVTPDNTQLHTHIVHVEGGQQSHQRHHCHHPAIQAQSAPLIDSQATVPEVLV